MQSPPPEPAPADRPPRGPIGDMLLPLPGTHRATLRRSYILAHQPLRPLHAEQSQVPSVVWNSEASSPSGAVLDSQFSFLPTTWGSATVGSSLWLTEALYVHSFCLDPTYQLTRSLFYLHPSYGHDSSSFKKNIYIYIVHSAQLRWDKLRSRKSSLLSPTE